MPPRFLLLLSFTVLLQAGCGSPASAGSEGDSIEDDLQAVVDCVDSDDLVLAEAADSSPDSPLDPGPIEISFEDRPAPCTMAVRDEEGGTPVLIVVDEPPMLLASPDEVWSDENATLATTPLHARPDAPVDERMAQVQESERRLDDLIERLEQASIERKTEQNVEQAPVLEPID